MYVQPCTLNQHGVKDVRILKTSFTTRVSFKDFLRRALDMFGFVTFLTLDDERLIVLGFL